MFNLGALFRDPDSSGVFVTAEIGINHQGDIALAKKLVDDAKNCGADAVKFQTFRTENFYNRKLSPGAFDLFRGFELGFDAFRELKAYADSRDILFYSTPLDFDSLDFLLEIKCPLIKVASSDITNEPFLHRISQSVRKTLTPVCLSTGFVGLDEVKKAFRFFRDLPVALMYCVSKYPADENDLDLNFIRTLRDNFYVPVGFSDHSTGTDFSAAAVGLGAALIERHFTDDASRPGADHAVSLDPPRFTELVKSVRRLEKARGSGKKKITGFEEKIRRDSMRGLYAARDIRKGETVGEKDILLARPGDGVTLAEFRKILNKKSPADVPAFGPFFPADK